MAEYESRTVRYQGPAPFVGLLAKYLREEGVEVSYAPRVEERGAAEIAQDVIVNLSCVGVAGAIKYAVQKFRESRLGQNAKVEIEDDDENDKDDG